MRKYAHNRNLFNILVYHGSLENLKSDIESEDWIDLVLLGHDQNYINTGIGTTYVVGCGKDSEMIAVISIHQQENKWIFDVKYDMISIQISEDEGIKSVIKKYEERIRE